MRKKNNTQKRTPGTRTIRSTTKQNLKHVTATLPDGQEVELYGDAVDMVQERRDLQGIVKALHELLHNPATPPELFEAVALFVCGATTDMEEDVLHSKDSLTRMVNAYPPEEAMGAIREARRTKRTTNKGVSHAEN